MFIYRILSIALLLFTSMFADAKQLSIAPTDNLQAYLDDCNDGDVIQLQSGRYLGNFVVNCGVRLTGTSGAIIDAQGKGNALLLKSSDVTVENLTIVNWGDDLTAQNAGIYSAENTKNLVLKNNRLSGDGFGIWLQKGQHIKVLNNVIEGNTQLRSADRGNGIQLSIVKNVEVSGNEVFHTRDGLYIISSQDNVLKNNIMHDLRYGVHYMYSHSNQVLNNYAYNTRAGYALMSSRNLLVQGNRTEGSEDYGFLMNFITFSEIKNNIIRDVWTKPENKVLGRDGKGLFIYNSGYNTVSGNLVEKTEIGIHLTAGSEQTKVHGNSFINNPVQVKYVSNAKQEWSQDGQGNYWSNYLGWDMDHDDIGDIAFEPNDGIDKLMWQYPEMKILMDSPAVIILRWIQRQFPVLKSPGVQDSFPLMRTPHFDEFQATAQPLSGSAIKGKI